MLYGKEHFDTTPIKQISFLYPVNYVRTRRDSERNTQQREGRLPGFVISCVETAF
jgi:hypothetical protein